MGRLLLAACLLACIAAAQTESASACSCTVLDPRRELAKADAAFVGVLLEQRITERVATFVFRVDEAVKGSLAAQIEVDSSASTGTCGLGVEKGVPIGLLLERRGNRWTSQLCWQLTAARLREAARPLPRPNGSGPTTLVVGGSFGEARLLALDRRGRTLAYGLGAGETQLLAVCPGGKRLAELVLGEPRPRIAVRSLPVLKRLRELPVSESVLGAQAEWPSALSCADPAGSTLFLLTTSERRSRVIRLRERSFAVLYQGPARHGRFAAGVAFLNEGAELIRLDLVSGARARLATLPEWTGPLSPSPDGSRLVGVATPPPLDRLTPPPRVVLIDLTTSRVRTSSLGRPSMGGDVHWLGNRRIVYLPTGGGDELARTFDTRLRTRSSFAGWVGFNTAVSGQTAYGLGLDGALRSAQLPAGPARRLPTLPSPVLRSLAVVPS